LFFWSDCFSKLTENKLEQFSGGWKTVQFQGYKAEKKYLFYLWENI